MLAQKRREANFKIELRRMGDGWKLFRAVSNGWVN
jgi:hypothetical protein